MSAILEKRITDSSEELDEGIIDDCYSLSVEFTRVCVDLKKIDPKAVIPDRINFFNGDRMILEMVSRGVRKRMYESGSPYSDIPFVFNQKPFTDEAKGAYSIDVGYFYGQIG